MQPYWECGAPPTGRAARPRMFRPHL